MKPAGAWKGQLDTGAAGPPIEAVMGRQGRPTLRAGNLWLHSQYDPEQEAARLVDSAPIDPARPVAVVGLGLGYHVRALIARGCNVCVFEPDPRVAAAALEHWPGEAAFPLAVGPCAAWRGDAGFAAFAALQPQVLVHPPTARLHTAYAAEVSAALSRAAFAGRHLNIAIVGPLYGGSLPIAGYLARAFRRLGHAVLEAGNDAAWPLYEQMTRSVEDPKASNQLGGLFTNVLAEWCYARVAEFQPEICIVLAQAPVGPAFPQRLAKHGIVTAFWYVENWRHLGYWRDIAPAYDYFFHIQPGDFERQLDAAGCAHHAFVQTGCDPELHRPVALTPEERAHYACDISFAGAGYHNRVQLFRGLTDYDFKIWGVDWNDRALARRMPDGERRFDSEEFVRIAAASAINLNLHSSASHEGVDPGADALNPRIFELAAAGAFQLCDPCIGLDAHFDPGLEIPVYRDLAELRARIDHYLAHPAERAEAAARARARALRDHTYDARAQQMLDLLLDAHGARLLKRGLRVQRSVAEVAQRLRADGDGGELAAWLESLPPGLAFTYEGILAMLGPMRPDMPAPERLFRYLHEVRSFSETMLKAAR